MALPITHRVTRNSKICLSESDWKERNNGRAKHYAKGVKRNHMASGRNGNSHVPRQLSEDTHDAKLGHAQPKCSER